MLTREQIETTETIGFKRCCACTAELLDRDKFCRRCGVKQVSSYATSTELTQAKEGETKLLPGVANGTEAYRSYSGQLIQIVAESMSARAATPSGGRTLRGVVCTLITIPIWMLIVMLSPLDAYAAAKAAAGCVDCR